MRRTFLLAFGLVQMTALVSCGSANRADLTQATNRPAASEGQPTSRPTLADGHPSNRPAVAEGKPTNRPNVAEGQPTNRPAVVEGWFGKEVRIGDLGVTLKHVLVRIQSGLDPSGALAFSDQEYLSVKLVIKNYNPNKLGRVPSQPNPRLTDEHDNNYEQVKQMKNNRGRPIATDFAIGADRVADVRSDQEATDAYVFSPPVPGANTLTLTLDAANYGGSGLIKFTVIRDEWDPKPKPKR